MTAKYEWVELSLSPWTRLLDQPWRSLAQPLSRKQSELGQLAIHKARRQEEQSLNEPNVIFQNQIIIYYTNFNWVLPYVILRKKKWARKSEFRAHNKTKYLKWRDVHPGKSWYRLVDELWKLSPQMITTRLNEQWKDKYMYVFFLFLLKCLSELVLSVVWCVGARMKGAIKVLSSLNSYFGDLID